MFDLFTVAKPFTFADDIKLLITWYTPEDSNLFQLDLQDLATWNNRWHLLLNTSKCRHLHFHFSNTVHSIVTYHINGDTLSTNNNIKDLGITFSTDLHWDVHYSKIVSKAYKMFLSPMMYFYYTLTYCQKASLFNNGQISVNLLFTTLEASPNQTHNPT